MSIGTSETQLMSHTSCIVVSLARRDLDLRVVALHGGMRQEARDRSLELFRGGVYQVLVATDVAARGLDVPNITAVVNTSFPEHEDSYVHRIGRTGRAGRTGEALTLVAEDEADCAESLVKVGLRLM